jgi:hypothetical protein
MVYSKSFLNNNPLACSYETIRDWGHIWNKRLKRELSSSKSFREIAKIMGTDAKTISRFSIGGVLSSKSPEVLDFKSYRNVWVRIFKTNKRGAKYARETNPSVYAWLYRNDRSWLLAFNFKHPMPSQHIKVRRNWAERDTAILQALENAHQDLKRRKVLKRFTKTLLLTEVHKEHYLAKKTLNRLPKVSAFLKEKSESVEQFQRRRVSHILDSNPSFTKVWQVQRAAGLSSKFEYVSIAELNKRAPILDYNTIS